MADKYWLGGADAVAQVKTYQITDPGGHGETWTWTITDEGGNTHTVTTSGHEVSIRNSTYQWTASGGGTNEYYVELAGGGDPSLAEPDAVYENSSEATKGTLGSLAAGEWGYGDNDTLGYSTVYIRLTDNTDPDSKSAGYVEKLTNEDVASQLKIDWGADSVATATATATLSNDTVTLTAASSGVPFDVTLAADGTGADTETTTTSSAGPNDYATAANWFPAGTPAANDNLFITGANAIQHNLDNSGVELDDVIIMPGCTAQIGTPEYPLKLDLGNTNRFEHNGTGQSWIDLGSAAVNATIKKTASVTAPDSGLHLTGTALGVVDVQSGSVRITGSSTVTTVKAAAGSRVVAAAGSSITNFHNRGTGSVLEVAAATVTSSGGSLTIEGSGAITTLTVDGGTVVANSTGTISTLNSEGGTTDFLQSEESRTVTTLNFEGGNVLYDPDVVTITNAIAGGTPLSIRAA